MGTPSFLSKTGGVAAVLVLLTTLGLLRWLDKTVPESGLWALLLLSVTVGFVHGALDTVLLPQRFAFGRQAAVMFVLYLLAVVTLGWLLGMAISLALWMLLLMSAWHFGEPYGRWNSLPAIASGLTRAVVGGAPVMLPALLASDRLAAILTGVVPEVGLQGWYVLALTWLGLLLVWLPFCGLPRIRALRYAWVELLASVLLYVLFSPLMAFALYFGVYHAPVHIWRVWRSLQTSSKAARSAIVVTAAVALTTLGTWLLGAGLWWFLSSTSNLVTDWATALRWLIVAFAALTAPHLVLISLCAEFLTKTKLNTARH